MKAQKRLSHQQQLIFLEGLIISSYSTENRTIIMFNLCPTQEKWFYFATVLITVGSRDDVISSLEAMTYLQRTILLYLFTNFANYDV